ncbi:uncharacterized protein [Venturia canescens]|uniref:uncharacterized protein n=1 Tax=Venturia canescens TaxID=32260 RepID=UPI001C9CE417|nr:uncharacterized protein LOC122405845 [Venturia canescens]XP_043266796.1 uncharacterized protein LOC122405845 [Venturia canescens]XP_043266797.1 uncharacterized protein LOC122405845 [Venturia canescens]
MDKCPDEPISNGEGNGNNTDIPEASGSPELGRKLSRIIAAREDARKLKTATLDRMGKLFKINSNRATNISNEPALGIGNESLEDQQSRKEKSNSLGRMLKLVDKNGEPRKLFNNSRSGSLSHMFRRKSTGTREHENSSQNLNRVGVFTRIFKQWKNGSGSGNATAEPNLSVSFPEENKSSFAKPPSSPKSNVSPTCTFSSPIHPGIASPVLNSTDIEYPA